MMREIQQSEDLAFEGAVRAPQNLVAGLALIGLAAFVLWAIGDLSLGTLQEMGPALLPSCLAAGIGLCGAALVIASFIRAGDAIERWLVRGPVLVALAVVVFAVTIRPLGLAVAGPLTMVIGGYATPDVRFKEIVVFAAVMTAFCIGLFRYALNLPIPVLILRGIIQI
jgi:Tripartite tricarboxylate transporter TctB family